MTVGVLTTCHTQYTWDRSICIFLFNSLNAELNPICHLLALLAHHILHVGRIRVNRTTLQVFVTYLTGALYAHPLWFYKHQHDNRVRSKLGWRERNQQDATNLMFIIKLLSQHVSGIIMPIIRRTRLCTAAYGALHSLWWLWLCGAGTQAVCTVKVTVRLMPETCWDKSLIINIRQVAPCWFLSLHPTFMMHGHKSPKFVPNCL